MILYLFDIKFGMVLSTGTNPYIFSSFKYLLLLPASDESGAMLSQPRNTEDHYTYIDMKQVEWDYFGAYWRPKGTVGDR